MSNIKLWIESNSSRSGTIGYCCRVILRDEKINWHCSHSEIFHQIALLEKTGKLTRKNVNKFLKTLRGTIR